MGKELAEVANLLLQAQNKNWARGSARTAVVLGGGISGLATAWYLKKLRGDLINVVVVDRDERVFLAARRAVERVLTAT
eukprot:SAG22_NODE_7891_length_700_cov_0.798669_2_plen_79_part_00